MSFFKKLTKEFEGLKASLGGDEDKDKDKKQKDAHASDHRAEHPHDAHAPYGQQPPSYNTYGGAPPQHGLQPGPPGPPGLPGTPSVPPGWLAQFDSSSQRWYYVEQATGRTQWEPPSQHGAYPPPSSHRGHSAEVAGFDGGYGSHGPPPVAGHGGYPPQGGDMYQGKAKKDKSGMLAGAAGGLAVGAAGGALAAHAMGDSDSDSEHPHVAAVPMQQPAQPAGYYTEPMPPAVAPVPTHTASGDSVSGSDQEDVYEARHEYEEAAQAAADSDASSSDHEELEEAREEYEEEVEDAYEDD